MIVCQTTDTLLVQAVRNAAHAEEEVVFKEELAYEALHLGFPRLVVRSGAQLLLRPPAGVPVLDLDDALLRRWEAERRALELPSPKLHNWTERLRVMMERPTTSGTWVDSTLAELGRAAGAPLPRPLRTFARRVFEFPSRYRTLHELADCCGLSRGALKARFRRRGLASPYTYLRWLRLLAVAQVLSDRNVTVAQAAHRLGFTSAGNLCRVLDQLAETTTTELRTLRGWRRLVVQFAWIHLTPEALSGWATLSDLFDRRAA